MRFLIDQDVFGDSTRMLKELGHDIITASEIGMYRAADVELLGIAGSQQRILVTRDRDFGELVFTRNLLTGVIYLRIPPAAQDAVHDELEKVLSAYPEAELLQSFVVVEPGRHRIRRLPRANNHSK